MKKIFISSFLMAIFLLSFITVAAAEENKKIEPPYFLNDSTQMVVVTTKSWNSPNGQLLRFERKNVDSPWKLISGKTPATVGKSGLGWSAEYYKYNLRGPYKREHDFKAPAGAFGLGPAFGFNKPSEKTVKLYYLPIAKTTVCVDDPNSKFYGRIVDSEKVAQKDWKTAEQMINYPGYKYGVMIDYNMGERHPDMGSCIFLQVNNPNDKDGTRGCTALPEHIMLTLLHWLDPQRNPVLVQMPVLEYQHLEKSWNLPTLSS